MPEWKGLDPSVRPDSMPGMGNFELPEELPKGKILRPGMPRSWEAEGRGYWRATVTAPLGGIGYTHKFEGPTVQAVLEEISRSLDLEAADYVEIELKPVAIVGRKKGKL